MPELRNAIVDAIYATQKQDAPRAYLGGSQIGEECRRRLWYGFRFVAEQKHEGRILRLFGTGHREEARIIEELRAAGFRVYDRDDKGEQFRYSTHDGHFSGGIDGVIEGLHESKEPHLLEIKTHNKKSFDAMEKNGIKPEHLAQLQVYMGMAELERALYVAVCKDDDRIVAERVKFEPKTFRALMLKANGIIKEKTPPEKLSNDPSFYKCKFCPFFDNCHGEKVADVSCRTCTNASPIEGGRWECDAGKAHKEIGSHGFSCDDHVFVSGLIPYAEQTSADSTHACYKMRADNRVFANVAATGFPGIDADHFSSKELRAIDPKAIGNSAVNSARKILGGRVVG
jgi:CRISPR/Cas system-associated exonuclease Cas4 (RecB family)